MSLAARLRDGLQLWTEARRAAAHSDSLFIWIPKNAGTSVVAALRPHGLVKLKSPRSIRLCFKNKGRVTFGHMSTGSLVDLGLVSQAFVDSAFKFAIVRDPYDRAVSLYRFLSGIDILGNWRRCPSFGEFLKLLADGYYDRIGPYNWRGLSQCNPQVEWLRDAWPDKIYKIEELGEFVSDISERWGVPKFDIPHLNTSSGTAELTQEERALIEQIYAEDFGTFGYARR